MLVTVTHSGGVAVVAIDNPPVNALSPGVPEGILAAIDGAEIDPSVTAVVVIGAGRTFIAGADIKELERAAHGGGERGGGQGPNLHRLLQRIEDCAKPVVMAIHGTALGGGLEVAMAGHFRVASPDAQMGQPEVNLGIIPGAEGTQRLPRLVGIAAAVEMCVSGKPIKAPEALRLGLIDRIVEVKAEGDLRAGAIEFARDARPGLKTRERSDKLGCGFFQRSHFCRRARDGPQDQAQHDCAFGRHRRSGSRGHAAVRRRLPARTRDSAGASGLR